MHRAGPRKKRGPGTGNEPWGKKRGPAPPRSVAKVPRPAPWCGAGRGFCAGPRKIQGPAPPSANATYLCRFDNNPLPGQITDAESPNPVIAGEDPLEDEFEVTRILDARINRQYRGGRLQFRVAWRGWLDDPTWYNADDGEFSHARDALNEFYALPSTIVRAPRSTEVSLPASPTEKSRDEPFFPGGGGVTGRRPPTRSLQTPITLP